MSVRPSNEVLRGAASLLFALVLDGATLAHAQPRPELLWLGDDAAGSERAASLAIEVAPRGANVSIHVAPPGASPAERALAAREVAAARGALAALWIETGADGTAAAIHIASPAIDAVLWAPISGGASDPRVVAMIAATLVDEVARIDVAATEEAARALALRAELARSLATPLGRASAPRTEGGAASLALPTSTAGTPAAASAQRRDGFVEIGAVVAGVAYGVVLGGGLYLDPAIRWDVRARLTYVILSGLLGSGVTTALAYVTDDDDGRFEVGGELGALLVEDGACPERCSSPIPIQAGFVAGGVAGFSWGPWPDVRIGVRLSATAAVIEGGVVPSAVLDLYLHVMP